MPSYGYTYYGSLYYRYGLADILCRAREAARQANRVRVQRLVRLPRYTSYVHSLWSLTIKRSLYTTTDDHSYLLPSQVRPPRQVHRAVGGGVGPAAARAGYGRHRHYGGRARRVPVRAPAWLGLGS